MEGMKPKSYFIMALIWIVLIFIIPFCFKPRSSQHLSFEIVSNLASRFWSHSWIGAFPLATVFFLICKDMICWWLAKCFILNTSGKFLKLWNIYIPFIRSSCCVIAIHETKRNKGNPYLNWLSDNVILVAHFHFTTAKGKANNIQLWNV